MAKCQIILQPNTGIVRGKISARMFSAFMRLPGHSKWKDGDFYFAHSKANLDIVLEAAGGDAEVIDNANRIQQLKEAHGHRVGQTDLAPRGVIELKLEPFDHQKRALEWGTTRAFGMYRMGVGTGKSYTMLLVGSTLFSENAVDRMLIVTRPIVKEDFLFEHLPTIMPRGIRWSAHDIVSHKKPSWESVDKSRLHIGLCTPSMFASKKGLQLITSFIKGGRCAIFVDECHDFSNPTAKRTLALEKVSDICSFKYMLTGTLTPKGLENLFAQYRFLHEDIIGHGSFTSFRNQFCVMGGFEGKDIVGYRESERLMSLVAPHTFYVDIKDCFDMPSQTWRKEGYKLGADHLKMFLDLKTKFVTILKEAQDELNEKMVELRSSGMPAHLVAAAAKRAMDFTRVVNTAAAQHVAMRGVMHGWFRPNPILGEDGNPIDNQPPPIHLHDDRVAPIIDTMLDDTRPIFIWCAYRDDVELVRAAFDARGHDIGLIIGGMSTPQKREVLALGKRNEIRAIVGTVGAGGTGVNGQFANHSVFFSNSYSWGNREQTEGRTWRAGQTSPCVYTDMMCRSPVARTIDGGYAGNLAKKKGIDLSLRGFLRMAAALDRDATDFGNVGEDNEMGWP